MDYLDLESLCPVEAVDSGSVLLRAADAGRARGLAVAAVVPEDHSVALRANK